MANDGFQLPAYWPENIVRFSAQGKIKYFSGGTTKKSIKEKNVLGKKIERRNNIERFMIDIMMFSAPLQYLLASKGFLIKTELNG